MAIEQQGGWSRQQREEMDQRFTDAMARALRSSQENPPAAAATVSSRGHAATFLYKRLSLEPPTPRRPGSSGQGPPGHPWGQAVPGGEGIGGDHRETAHRILCHVRDSSTGCDARAQNRMQRGEFRVKVRQEPSSVSLYQP
jgi:hypothetical protein